MEIDLDGFCSWVVQHEHEVVGKPGMCYDDPLAHWLSALTGHVMGVDGDRYGCALSDWESWWLLPRWAKSLRALSERLFPRPVTGAEVFDLLASLEGRRLWSAM